MLTEPGWSAPVFQFRGVSPDTDEIVAFEASSAQDLCDKLGADACQVAPDFGPKGRRFSSRGTVYSDVERFAAIDFKGCRWAIIREGHADYAASSIKALSEPTQSWMKAIWSLRATNAVHRPRQPGGPENFETYAAAVAACRFCRKDPAFDAACPRESVPMLPNGEPGADIMVLSINPQIRPDDPPPQDLAQAMQRSQEYRSDRYTNNLGKMVPTTHVLGKGVVNARIYRCPTHNETKFSKIDPAKECVARFLELELMVFQPKVLLVMGGTPMDTFASILNLRKPDVSKGPVRKDVWLFGVRYPTVWSRHPSYSITNEYRAEVRTMVESTLADSPTSSTADIATHLAELISRRAAEFGATTPDYLPGLPELRESARNAMWFPVDGMYGGFKFELVDDVERPHVRVESWSRTTEGSESIHIVEPSGYRLLK